jgi:hypothetical protein
MPVALILTILGAGLFTILAAIKIWEIYRQRKRLLICYSLSGDSIIGDKIIIYNRSESTVVIEHWQLLWTIKRLFLRKKFVPIHVFDDKDCYLNLTAKSMRPLNFNGQYHFNWNPEIEKNVKLFIKLRIAGQKKFLIKPVYPAK